MRSAEVCSAALGRSGRLRYLAALFAAAMAGYGNAATAAETLAREKGCMGCHAVDKPVVGPTFKAVALRYVKTPGAVPMVARHIREGLGGAWGDLRMPAQDHVLPAEAETLAKWVLGR
jgi:cytochrome c